MKAMAQTPSKRECGANLLFVTSFRELSPTAFFNRKSTASYYVAWLQLAWNIEYPLVTYLQRDGAIMSQLRNLPSNGGKHVRVITEPINQSFFELLPRVRQVLASQQFNSLLPPHTRSLRLPEYTVAEYSVINHDKIKEVSGNTFEYFILFSRPCECLI